MKKNNLKNNINYSYIIGGVALVVVVVVAVLNMNGTNDLSGNLKVVNPTLHQITSNVSSAALPLTTSTGIFLLSPPADNATGISVNPTLSWKALPGAINYHLLVYKNDNFVKPAVEENLTTTNYTLKGLSANTKYSWLVFAVNGSGKRVSSELWHFTTAALTPTPTAPLQAVCSPSSPTPNVGDSIKFTVAATGGSAPYTYTWPSNVTSNAQNPNLGTAIYSSPGSESFNVSVSDKSGKASVMASCAVTVQQPAPVAAAPALKVAANQLQDANGKTIRLLGVNRSGQEYACVQGWGPFDGPTDLSSAQAIASWHANTVRVPLNEDCWLGINGVNPQYAGANYQNAIKTYVNTLHQAGLYVILDLHWSAPGSILAEQQQPLPDADHAVAFWTSVANSFKSDQAVVFDLFNEPFLYEDDEWYTFPSDSNYLANPPENPPSKSTAAENQTAFWNCWLNGCNLRLYQDANSNAQSYAWSSVGMQTLVNTVRNTGAKNVIMVGGMDWANDLSGWLANEPEDPLNSIVASWHSYPGEGCSPSTCWNSVIAPLAAKVPVVIGEVGDNVVNPTYLPGPSGLLQWANSNGLSYLGWTWNAWGASDNDLITDYSGTPTNSYGQIFKADLCKISGATNC
jgi:hypothetical protein